MSKIAIEFTQLIGADLYAKLVVNFGGQVVYISKKPFFNLLGPGASAALGSQYAGYTVRIPNGRYADLHRQRLEIISLLQRGVTPQSIHAEYGVSIPYIYKLRSIVSRETKPSEGRQSAQSLPSEQGLGQQPPPK